MTAAGSTERPVVAGREHLPPEAPPKRPKASPPPLPLPPPPPPPPPAAPAPAPLTPEQWPPKLRSASAPPLSLSCAVYSRVLFSQRLHQPSFCCLSGKIS